jgi:predicted lipoprotein with Yx(FWY)xxD motif
MNTRIPVRLLISLAGIAVVAALVSPAAAQSTLLKKSDGVLVDSAGKTVYTFDKDAAGSGKSSCNGQCAANWPPVEAPAQPTAPYSTVTREDGTKQLAYMGKPLYTYKADTRPGERKGDKFKDMWHVVKE